MENSDIAAVLALGAALFIAVGRERGHFRVADTEIPLAIRTSRIYQRINGQWKQLHHHGSMDDPALLQTYQTAVLGQRRDQ